MWFVATAGVVLFKGPQARRYTQRWLHTQGGAHTKRNTQKAVRGQRMSHVIERATGKAVRIQGGAHTRQNTQKAVCGHRGSHFM